MCFFAPQSIVITRQHIRRQFHLRNLFLLLLHLVLRQVQLILNLTDPIVILSDLLGLPLLVPLERPQFLNIVRHATLILDQILTQTRVLRHSLVKILLQTLVLRLKICKIFAGADVLRVKVPVISVHLVELLFELETQLDFLFVVARVLRILLLKFKAHLPLIHPLLLKRLRVLLQNLHVLLDDLLIISLLGEFGLVV